jgi:hypothetical protein
MEQLQGLLNAGGAALRKSFAGVELPKKYIEDYYKGVGDPVQNWMITGPGGIDPGTGAQIGTQKVDYTTMTPVQAEYTRARNVEIYKAEQAAAKEAAQVQRDAEFLEYLADLTAIAEDTGDDEGLGFYP